MGDAEELLRAAGVDFAAVEREHADELSAAQRLVASVGVDAARITVEANLVRLDQALSGVAEQALSDEYDLVRSLFPDEEIFLEQGSSFPYVRVREGDWELRFFPENAVEVHRIDDGKVDSFELACGQHVPFDVLEAVSVTYLGQRLQQWIRLHGAWLRDGQEPRSIGACALCAQEGRRR